jgi:hypothetical protein
LFDPFASRVFGVRGEGAIDFDSVAGPQRLVAAGDASVDAAGTILKVDIGEYRVDRSQAQRILDRSRRIEGQLHANRALRQRVDDFDGERRGFDAHRGSHVDFLSPQDERIHD